MAISGTVVQAASNTAGSGTKSITTTLGGAATAGNLLVAVYAVVGGNSYTTFTAPTGFTIVQSTIGASHTIRGYVAVKEAAGGETSFTGGINGGTTPSHSNLTIFELPGTDLSLTTVHASNEDVSNVQGTADIQSTGSASLSANTGLAIGVVIGGRYTDWDSSAAWSDSFMSQVAQNSGQTTRAGVFAATKVLSASGAVSTSYSVTDTGNNSYGAILIFEGAGATAPDPESPPDGKTVVEITEVPEAGTESFVLYAHPDLAVGDLIVADAVTSPGGYPFTVYADGTFSYDAAGDESRQTVNVNAWDASAEAYIGETTFYVNNVAPTTVDGDTDAIVLSFGTSEEIADIDLYDYFEDYEGDALDFTVSGSSVDDVTDAGLTLEESTISGTTTGTPGVYKVLIRATDIVGDYVEREIWFSVDAYPFGDEQDLLLDAGEYAPGDTITYAVTPEYGVPASATIGGAAVALAGDEDESGGTIELPTRETLFDDDVPFGLTELVITFDTGQTARASLVLKADADANTPEQPYFSGNVSSTQAGKGIFANFDLGQGYLLEITQGAITGINESGEITYSGFYGGTLYRYEA